MTISTEENYRERTAILKMVNTPQVTGIQKDVATALYDVSKDLSAYQWADTASFTNLLPETETVTVLFKVVVTGAPGAQYSVTDVLKDTANAQYNVSYLSGDDQSGEIPDDGDAVLYYTAELTPTTSKKIYTNTASVGSLSDTAKVTIQKQQYPRLSVVIKYWFQNEYGVYGPIDTAYHQDSSLAGDKTQYMSTTTSVVQASTNYLASAPTGYELSKKVSPSPAQVTYAEAYAQYKEDPDTPLVINIYYDLKNPTATVRADKGWTNSYVTSDGQSIVSPFQNQLKTVTYELQRTTTPSDPNSWTMYKESTFNVSATGSSSVTWYNVEIYKAGTPNKYSYRVVETAINGTALTGENRVLGYAPAENNQLVNNGEGLTNRLSPYYVAIQNEYMPDLQTIQDGTKASFTVVKLDENNAALADAKFTLTKAGDPSFSQEKLSDSNGQIVFENLTDGTYYLEETDAPTNYNLSTSKWTITVKKDALVYGQPDSDNQVTVTQNYSVESISGDKDSQTGKDYDISGTTITVHDERLTTPENAGLTIKKVVTAESGVTAPTNDEFTFTVVSTGGSYQLNGETVPAGTKTITLKGGETATIGSIDYGTTFTITETAKNGYTLESVVGGTVSGNSTTVTIDESTTSAEVTFTNHYITRGFDIQKVDEDNAQTLLSGAKFTVYTYDEETGNKGNAVKTTAATGADGKTSVSNLPVGTYWMEETTAPENYVLSDDAWIIRVTTSDITVEDANPSAVGQLINFLTGSDLLDNGTLTVTNTATEYQLTITKTVTGIEEFDQSDFQKQYFFNVYQNEKKLNTVAFTVDVSYNKETKTISGSTTISSKDNSWLKAGTYEVREDTALADTEHYKLDTTNSILTQNVTLTHDQTEATITVEADTLTNAYTHKTGTLEISKVVSGLVGKDAREDHTYEIQVTAADNSSTTYKLTVNGNGTVTWADAVTQSETITLPTGTYLVEELNGSLGDPYYLNKTYKFTQNGKDVTGLEIKDSELSTVTVTNAYGYLDPIPEEYDGEISGTKVWNDGNDADGLRPDSIRVQLFYGEDAMDGAYADVTGGDFTIAYDAYRYDEEEKITVREVGYTVDGTYTAFTDKITSVPGYDAPVYADGNTITNTHAYSTVDITVEKVWGRNTTGRQRPVTLHLMANGTEVEEITLDGTIDATELEAWKATLEDLPLNEGGKAIDYTVTEDSLGRRWSYDVTVTPVKTGDDVTDYEIVVENRYSPRDDDDDDDETNIPDEDPPTTDLPDEDPPTTDLPDEDTPTTDLPDEDVPLADVPSTGDNLIAWVLAAAVSGVGLVWLAISGKKRKDEQGE